MSCLLNDDPFIHSWLIDWQFVLNAFVICAGIGRRTQAADVGSDRSQCREQAAESRNQVPPQSYQVSSILRFISQGRTFRTYPLGQSVTHLSTSPYEWKVVQQQSLTSQIFTAPVLQISR
jgi:hypothetical protein